MRLPTRQDGVENRDKVYRRAWPQADPSPREIAAAYASSPSYSAFSFSSHSDLQKANANSFLSSAKFA